VLLKEIKKGIECDGFVLWASVSRKIVPQEVHPVVCKRKKILEVLIELIIDITVARCDIEGDLAINASLNIHMIPYMRKPRGIKTTLHAERAAVLDADETKDVKH